MLLLLLLRDTSEKASEAYCSIKNNNINILQEDFDGSIVSGYWNDSLNDTGWYTLKIISNNNEDNSINVMRCAGALEGYLSYERIYNHFMLIKDINGWNRSSDYPENIKNFMESNMQFIKESTEAYVDSSYWNKVSLIYEQFKGLVEGYDLKNELSGFKQNMSKLDHWILQSEGDLMDVVEKYPDLTKAKKVKTLPGDHCTGMIRILPDYSDLYFSHDAWSDFRELHGELKEYNLNISEFEAKRITMSTRVGKISSYDDLYVNDKGLMIMETTLSNFNEDLFEYVKPNSIFTWIRAVLSTWCATSGKDWVDYFSKSNSGTYNNEYLIVDTNKFEFFEKPTNDLLWIIEQMPGIFMSADITDILVNQSYFASFNTPYFTNLFNLAQYPEKIASWGIDGSYWDYQNASRRLIAKRELPFIYSFDDFKKFMRYNNYARDPYSAGDPGQMILSRYDLRDGSNPHFVRHMFGGLDSKVLRLTEAKYRMTIHALASPAFSEKPEDKLPPFKFTDWPQYNHDGLYEGEWMFNWTTFESSTPDICYNKTRSECLSIEDCGWCYTTETCLPGNDEGPFFGSSCKGSWSRTHDNNGILKHIGVALLVVTITTVGVFIATRINKINV